MEKAAPAFQQQREEQLVQFHVVCIRFALIPYNTPDAIPFQGEKGRLEHISRCVWMTLQPVPAGTDIQQGPFTCPLHAEITVIPVVQDGRKLPLQCLPVNPRLCGSTADGIADDAYRNLQAVCQHPAEMISHGRESRQ